MPNWCNNYIEVSHEDPSKIRALADALNNGEFCSHVIPTPKELTETVAGSVGEDKRAEHEAQMASNLEKFGHTDWYSFQTSRWGTKWDVGGDGQTDIHPDGKTLFTTFDSAWSPPVNAYQKLEQLGFRVSAQFYESGMAFAGVYEDGNCEDFSLEGMTADEIERDYPELDEAFCIAEAIREFQEEEEEELTEWIKDGVDKNLELKSL